MSTRLTERVRRATAAVITVLATGCGYTERTPESVQVADTGVGALPYYGDATFTPSWFPAGEAPDDFHTISDFELLDQRGEAVTRSDLSGKIYVANFFFTDCAGICPLTMASLTRLREELADDLDVALVSHSVAPQRDDVDRLAAFADQIGAVAPEWYLLTGETDALYELGRDAFFADEDLGQTRSERDADRFLHSETFYLVDQDHHIRGVYNGMSRTAVNHLIEDIRQLQREHSSY
ncbi:MAG: SCO family protein [Gemmatimonadota bacterium]